MAVFTRFGLVFTPGLSFLIGLTRVTGFLIFFPEHPWPRPDLQGLSSMVTATEIFQPQHSVPCNSRQGRPVYPVQKMGFPILSS